MCFLVRQGSVVGALLWTSNFRPNARPRVQPNLQMESPFQWPLLSMCSSSKSNTRAKNMPHRACLSVQLSMHPNRQFPGLFRGSFPLVFAYFALCHASLVFPRGRWGARELALWVCSPGNVRIPVHAGGYYSRGRTKTAMKLIPNWRKANSWSPSSRLVTVYKPSGVAGCRW